MTIPNGDTSADPIMDPFNWREHLRMLVDRNGNWIDADNPLPVGGTLGVGDMTADAWGVQKISLPHSLVHGMWTFDVPEKTWFMYENGTQVYTSTEIISTGGAGQLTTTAANHTLCLESRECPMYQPNRGHLWSSALIFPNKTNDGVREFGLGTVENQATFRLKADGLLYAVIRSGNVETYETVIDTSGLTNFDVEKGNVYDVQFQWRGVGSYFFFINLQLVHTVEYLGALDVLSIENPAMPMRFYAKRTTQDVSMKIGCADITSENGRIESHQYESALSEGVSISSDDPVLVLHNPLQINGNTNTRTVQFARVTVTCSKKAVFKVWTTRDPADITGETLQTLNNGSFMQTDSPDMDPTAVRATAVTVANLNFVTAIPVEALKREATDNPLREKIIFPIVRGDYLIITGTAASGSADCVVEWGEQI